MTDQPRLPTRPPRSPVDEGIRVLRVFVPVLVLLALTLVPSLALADEPDLFTRGMAKGPLFAALGAFAGGVLVSLTPCVYPMIVITVSIFGASEAKSRLHAMGLSTAFVLGIVALFTPMIVGAALTGSIFGSLLANKLVILALVAVFLALAASMFGAFDIVLPESVMQRLNTVGGIGYGGAFLLGLVSGLVAAPCTGPVLGQILIWIATTRSIVRGSLVGVLFSLGLGLPFWLVGTFAISLPKGGKWMLWVKSFFGVAMVATALYFLKNAFPALKGLARPDTTFLVESGAVALVGLALGAVHLSWDDGAIAKIRKGAGIALTSVGAFLFVTAMEIPRESAASGGAEIRWGHSEPEASDRARSERRPLIVDFTADWCGACKDLARVTLSDPRVTAKLAKFVVVKVDATNDEDPQVDQVKGKYKVVGLPTVVVFDSEGNERKRFTRYVEPEPFLAAIDGIQ